MKKLIVGILLVQGFLSLSPAFAQTQLFGRNLLKNGNAEAGQGTPDGAPCKAPGWACEQEWFTVVKYGASSGYPTNSTAGPPTVGVNSRGKNFFGGGNGAETTAIQEIDLSAGQETIDTGKVKFDLSGWLGGYENQEDNALVNVEFYAENGDGIKDATIGPVTNTQRNGATKFLFKQATGLVPAGARKAIVTMKMLRTEGKSNDGYVDHVSLKLIAPPQPKEASGK